jgi:hypothetical protein
MTRKEQEALDRANPFKNKQLRTVLLIIIGLGVALSVSWLIQGVPSWYLGILILTGFAGFVWLMAYLLRHNP